MQTHKMDYMLFALIDKLKQTKLYQELKIVVNLEKSCVTPWRAGVASR